jgi:hypothetical protein
VAKVIGVWRLLGMALTAVVASSVAVLLIGPWGWTDGVEVRTGPTITGPVPEPSVEPGVLYASPDGSIRIPDPTVVGDDHTVRFDVTAVAQPDHSVRVTEDITQSFATSRHGIEREIPMTDDNGEHAMRWIEVSTDAGTPGDVALSDSSIDGRDAVTVRIGDADTTIRGVHRYRLTYVLENVVSDPAKAPTATTVDPIGDVLRSDGGVVGSTSAPTASGAAPAPGVERVALDAYSAWRQRVYGTTYVLRGPDGAVAASCAQGSVYYRVACASTAVEADGATFVAAAPIEAYNDVTVQVDWPAGTFGPALIEGPERGTWPVRALAVAVSLLGVVVVALAAATRRRRLWARTRRGVVATFGGTVEPGSDQLVPRSAHTDPPLEFVPPMGLRPAELLRLEQGPDADASRLIASTVIDLAAGGELELVAAPDDEDWVARRRPGGAGRPLRSFEERLLSALIPAGGGDARFGDRAAEMGEARDQILGELDDDLRNAGLVERRLRGTGAGIGARVIGAVVLFAAAVGAAAFMGVFLQSLPWRAAMLLAGSVVAVVVGGWGLTRVRRAGRDRTTKGLGAGYRAEGFRRFFDESEEMHAKAAADAGLLRQYLGYAVAFDAVDRWVDAFDAPDLTWMGAGDVAWVNAWAYGSMMHRASTPPAPVSSGSSSGGFGGGFGGGGFGGGSGGGGGGSW